MNASFQKVELPLPQTAADDPRVGHCLGRKIKEGAAPRVVLIGFPCDEGVRRNGGRPGAAMAPTEVRRYLVKLTPDARLGDAFVDLLAHTADWGDIPVSSGMEAAQELLGQAVLDALSAGAFPVVLGGGHETAFGHFLGYVNAGRAVSILNWDAHPDVRPLAAQDRGHSGSPFRQALLHPSGLCRRYEVAGVLPQAAAAAHLDFITQRGGRVHFRDQLSPAKLRRLYGTLRTPAMITFDIDAVEQAHAPGVSAPGTGGMDTNLWLQAAFEAGRSPAVTSFDLVELNPVFDRDGITARLAALTVYHLLRGLASRKAPAKTARKGRRQG